MTPTRTTLVATVAAIAVVTMAGGMAHAQSISGASASTSGSTGNGGDGSGSRAASVAIQVNNGSQLKTRYAWNLSSDVGVFSTKDTNGSAQHNLSFSVTAPGAYLLTVDTSRVGDMNRANDASGCDGSADISGVSGGFTGGSMLSARSASVTPVRFRTAVPRPAGRSIRPRRRSSRTPATASRRRIL